MRSQKNHPKNPSLKNKPLFKGLSLETLKERILGFQLYYEQIAKPFEWKFTRNDLNIVLNKVKLARPTSEPVAA